MKRWYFWVLAPIAVTLAIGLPLLASGGVAVYGLSAWLLLATLGMADPIRFRWALIVVGAVALSVVVVGMIAENLQPKPPRPPLPNGVRTAYDISGGLFMCIGLVVALMDTIGATQWELRRRRGGNYSQLPFVPPILYLVGGSLLGNVHPGWRPAAVWLLIVIGTLAFQAGLPSLARAWAARSGNPRL